MDIALPSRSVVFCGVTPDVADVEELKRFDPGVRIEHRMVRVPILYRAWIGLALLVMDREDVEAMCADRLYRAGRWR